MKLIRGTDLHNGVFTPRLGGDTMHDEALEGLPEPVQARVRHIQASEQGLTVAEATVRYLGTPEGQRFYREFDRQHGLHPTPPQAPKRAVEPDEAAPDPLKRAQSELNAHVAEYCAERNLQVDDAAAVAAAIGSGNGPKLYAALDAAKTAWLRSRKGE